MSYTMDGLRSLSFSFTGGSVSLSQTDFYVLHSSAEEEGGRYPIVTIAEAWWSNGETLSETLASLQGVESLIRSWNAAQGKRGTLVLDAGTPGATTYSNYLLETVSIQWSGQKGFFEVSLAFKGSFEAGGKDVFTRGFKLKSYPGGAVWASSSGFPFIERTNGQSETQYKELYRTNRVRVPGGLPLQEHSFSGVVFLPTLTDPSAQVVAFENQVNALIALVGGRCELVLDEGMSYTRTLTNLEFSAVSVSEISPTKLKLDFQLMGGWLNYVV